MSSKFVTAAAALLIGASVAQAQQTSSTRIPVRKDVPPMTTTTSNGSVMPMDSLAMDEYEWYRYTGSTCSGVDPHAAHEVQIKSDLYTAGTMISPDSAKVIALCAVPGQVTSGEMNLTDGRTEYAITIIPNKKKTHTKVVVDAKTGAVLSSKQFGGLRGLAGWVRESAEHKANKQP